VPQPLKEGKELHEYNILGHQVQALVCGKSCYLPLSSGDDGHKEVWGWLCPESYELAAGMLGWWCAEPLTRDVLCQEIVLRLPSTEHRSVKQGINRKSITTRLVVDS
jgi:hypothetical protein